MEPLYSGHPWRMTLIFGRYIHVHVGVAFIEGLFCTQTVHLGPGFLAVIQRWPLFRGGRSTHCIIICCCMLETTASNEGTAGADASVKTLKLYC